MPPAPPPCWKVLHLPKRGNTAEEYEDAWAADAARGRYAVADGASESTYAGLWSRLLAESFVAARRPWNDRSWIDEPRRLWAETVDALDLPWYAEMKREQGAHATLIGLDVRASTSDRPGRWHALAVGDACLFQVRGQQVHAFPLLSAEEFGNRPRLLCSRPGRPPLFAIDRGSLRPGDRLYLMTDALAQWFLTRHEQKQRPWDDLVALLAEAEPCAAFASWIEAQRDRTDLRNDDVTLLSLEFAPAACRKGEAPAEPGALGSAGASPSTLSTPPDKES
jgi:Protein phosphatase 2C